MIHEDEAVQAPPRNRDEMGRDPVVGDDTFYGRGERLTRGHLNRKLVNNWDRFSYSSTLFALSYR